MTDQINIKIQIQREPGCEDIKLPEYQTSGSAGMDIHAAVDEDVFIEPGSVQLISAGFRMAIPEGYEVQVRPRSGLALKFGIGVLNSPGTIDSDYRGIVGIILINLGKSTFKIKRNDRIAQMVVQPVIRARLEPVSVLVKSQRQDGGFGSTGI